MERFSFAHPKRTDRSSILLPNIHDYHMRVTADNFGNFNTFCETKSKLPTILHKQKSRGSVINPPNVKIRAQSREGRSTVQSRQQGNQFKTVAPINTDRLASRRVTLRYEYGL